MDTVLRKERAVNIVTAIGLIAGLVLSWELWLSERAFPLLPVFKSIPAIPHPIDLLLLYALLGTLMAMIVGWHTRVLRWIVVCLLILLALTDQMRWQPWVYQYLLILLALNCTSRSSTSADMQKITLRIICLILIGTYAYSGLQKMNENFVGTLFPWFIHPFAALFPESWHMFIQLLGIGVPLMEIGIAIGLLTPRFRKAAVILGVGMHLCILLLLGPLGHNWNTVIWPWNVGMAALLIILFWRNDDTVAAHVRWREWSMPQAVIIACSVILPALSFFGMWDAYLSAGLYSGNTSAAEIRITNRVASALPEAVRQYAIPFDGYGYSVEFFDWSMGTLNVPPYPERRIYKGIAKSLCEYAEEDADVVLTIYARTAPYGTKGTERYSCGDLE